MAGSEAICASDILPDTFHLWLIGDGFRAEDEAEFHAAASRIIAELMSVPPFNFVLNAPGRLAIWGSLLDSPRRGPRPAASPGPDTVLGALIDTAGVLTLDDSKVAATLLTVPLEPDSFLPSTIMLDKWWSARGLAVVLIPPESAGAPLSIEADHLGPFWVATTIDGNVGWFLAHAIGRCLGLGEEWSGTGPNDDRPSAADAAILAGYPNLITDPLPAAAPEEHFKWWNELGKGERNESLQVVRANGTSTGGNGFAVFEGGGGFRRGVYRTEPACLMRRRIGGPDSPRFGTASFCRVCRKHLTGWIPRDLLKPTLIAHQRSAFEKVSWSPKPALRPITSSSQKFVVTPAGPMTRWSFQVEVSTANGLVITDLRLLDQGPTSRSEETVAERIEFRDLAVEFGDGSKAPFDVATALASSTWPPRLRVAGQGSQELDNLYQAGIDLALRHDFGGRCPVELSLSFVARGPAHDFDPTGGIVAAKFYPQIAWRWLGGGSTFPVRFRGAVRLVFNNKLKSEPHHGMSMPDETIVSLFADANPSFLHALPNLGAAQSGRNPRVSIGTTPYSLIPGILTGGISSILRSAINFADRPVPAFPLWAFIFDYHKPDVRSEVEIIGVHGPRSIATNPQYATDRSGSVIWPPGFTWSSRKYPRQGAYDNVHLHGSMGDDPIVPGTPMVHAPGCAEACIHLHWRWGRLTALPLPGSEMSAFAKEGWTDEGQRSEQSTAGLPLVPPNQDVSVALTHPATTRSDPWAAVVTTSTALDPKRKVLWYTTDVTKPRREQWQIMMPMGLGFAFAYRPCFIGSVNEDILSTTLKNTAFEPHTLIADKTERSAALGHDLYSLSRWYTKLTPTTTTLTGPQPQIPLGSHPTVAGTKLEDL